MLSLLISIETETINTASMCRATDWPQNCASLSVYVAIPLEVPATIIQKNCALTGHSLDALHSAISPSKHFLHHDVHSYLPQGSCWFIDNNSTVFKYFQGLCVNFQAPHCLLEIQIQGKIEASNDEKS